MGKLRRAFDPWRGLPIQLFLLVILPFSVLAVAATLMSVGLHQDAMRTMVAERDLLTVEISAGYLENRLRSEQELVNLLAGQSDYGSFESFIRAIDPVNRNLALVTDQNQVLSYSGREEIKSALVDMHINPGEIPTILVAGEQFIVLSAETESGFLVVNIVPVEPLLIQVVGSGFLEKPDNAIALVDSQNRILAQLGSMDWEGEPGEHPGVMDALNGKSGYTYISTSTKEHVAAYSPIALTGWMLIIEEPWEAVDNPYLSLTQFAPLILVPLLVFTLVALWFGASQIVKPLQKLESLASELAWGNFKAVEKSVGGVLEIRQLQNELIHLANKVQDAQKSLHGYIGAINQGQEDERRRLARELHDETLQSLIALRQRIQLIQLKGKDGEFENSLNELESLSITSIEELRRLTRALRPIYLEEFGLVTALEMLARESSLDILKVDLSIQGTVLRLEPQVELNLFRVVQEALSNVSRHAEATQVKINLDFQPETLSIQIQDNGKGFEPPHSPAEFAPAGHYGLLGIYERVDLLGGKLSIQSSPEGTSLLITVQK